jgi:AcrR family transcriptional regulator
VRRGRGRPRDPETDERITTAAAELLLQRGFDRTTVDDVAARAGVGKATVYRRWPSKEDLVADALQAGLPRFDEAPDLGSVREDLQALCRQARDAMYSRPGFALRSVIHECDTMQAERFHGVIYEGVVEPTIKLLREVINRGIERGEVRPDAANGYVFDAIPAMMMYRSKMCGSEWGDRDIDEMIDQLMVPLLRRQRG